MGIFFALFDFLSVTGASRVRADDAAALRSLYGIGAVAHIPSLEMPTWSRCRNSAWLLEGYRLASAAFLVFTRVTFAWSR
jgi:hypothetical protein